MISNRPGVPALDRAYAKGVPAFVVEPGEYGKWPGCKPAYERKLVEILKAHGVELVVLAGYDRLVGETFLEAFPMKVINVHPSLLPAFPGLNAQKQALDYGVKVAGASVFLWILRSTVAPSSPREPALYTKMIPLRPFPSGYLR